MFTVYAIIIGVCTGVLWSVLANALDISPMITLVGVAATITLLYAHAKLTAALTRSNAD